MCGCRRGLLVRLSGSSSSGIMSWSASWCFFGVVVKGTSAGESGVRKCGSEGVWFVVCRGLLSLGVGESRRGTRKPGSCPLFLLVVAGVSGGNGG